MPIQYFYCGDFGRENWVSMIAVGVIESENREIKNEERVEFDLPVSSPFMRVRRSDLPLVAKKT